MPVFDTATRAARHLLGERFLSRTLGFTLFGTGGYVGYKDFTRYRRMQAVYSRGNLLPPLADNANEVCYFSRPSTEEDVKRMLSPTFSNEYYLIQGEIGTGKTRTILEIVRAMHEENITARGGAPIYVMASQGKSFPETLGEAVGFQFDEHLSFNLFLDYVLGVRSFPSQDNQHRLHRVLQAIEESAFEYSQKNRVPLVLVIDGTDNLERHLPGTVVKLQEKAKLWADANIAKVIFVTNDEDTEELFKESPGNWSRMGALYRIGDLSVEESVRFLRHGNFLETTDSACRMTQENAEKIVDLVGGRLSHLITFKREFISGVPFDVTAARLKRRELEKFVSAAKDPQLMEAIEKVKRAPGKCLPMSSLVKATGRSKVVDLARQNVLKLERNDQGMLVAFESKLTENVVKTLITDR